MNRFFVFFWIVLGFVAMAFWEAYIEGKNPWAKKQVGWKYRFNRRVSITAYHFWVYVMLIIFLSLPLIILGWSTSLFGLLLSSSLIGLIAEDFTWFVANPFYSLKNWNSKEVYWYPWVKLGRFEIPTSYVLGILISLVSWWFLWR